MLSAESIRNCNDLILFKNNIRDVLYSSDLQNFFEKTVSSMIDAFEIDCAALFIYQHDKDKFCMVNSSGMTKESKIISSDWISKHQEIARGHAGLLTGEKIHDSQFNDLGLHHACYCDPL